MGRTDFIGGRAEAIAFACLTRVCRDDGTPYFWPHYLGEKCQSIDFFVELVGAGERTPFFFAQVKGTRKEYTWTQVPPRLRVEVGPAEVRRMVGFPAPTYVIGVHEREERAFVSSVHGSAGAAIASLTTAHELTCDTLAGLWDEVRTFWDGRNMVRVGSRFSN